MLEDVDKKVGTKATVAKHRHESAAKPTGRLVPVMDAIIKVTEHMIAGHSKDGSEVA